MENIMRNRKRIPVEERLYRGIDTTDTSDNCWEYNGYKPRGSKSYGYIQIEGRAKIAHRVSYELNKGEIPKGYVVMHSCDNPCCINPAHLSVGTNKDNSQDMVRKGRHKYNIGAESYNTKFKDEDIIEIRKKLLDGKSISSVSREYGVSWPCIQDIKLKRTWKHIN